MIKSCNKVNWQQGACEIKHETVSRHFRKCFQVTAALGSLASRHVTRDITARTDLTERTEDWTATDDRFSLAQKSVLIN